MLGKKVQVVVVRPHEPYQLKKTRTLPFFLSDWTPAGLSLHIRLCP